MRVFVTGATGFIGSIVVTELLAAGHYVSGLARNDASATALTAAGAQVHRGDLQDLDSLKRGAAAADGVIHTAFIHDFSKFAENGRIDEAAIAAMGETLAGTDKPLVVTSGTALVSPGALATEAMRSQFEAAPRRSEQAAEALANKGVRAMSIRLPPTVHGAGDHGFIPQIMKIAREKGVSVYVGDGANRWPAVHRFDAARLYALALEKGAKGGVYHGVAEDGVPTRQIAETIGKHLGVETVSKTAEEASEHLGFLGMFFGLDCPASSVLTQQQLGWTYAEIGLLNDMAQHYFEG